MTFSLDDGTVAKLRQSAARLAKPQSAIVREAIGEYADRVGRLSDGERRHLLHLFDTLVPAIPPRPARDVVTDRVRRREGVNDFALFDETECHDIDQHVVVERFVDVDVAAEIRAIRAARRAGGRRHGAKRT